MDIARPGQWGNDVLFAHLRRFSDKRSPQVPPGVSHGVQFWWGFCPTGLRHLASDTGQREGRKREFFLIRFHTSPLRLCRQSTSNRNDWISSTITCAATGFVTTNAPRPPCPPGQSEARPHSRSPPTSHKLMSRVSPMSALLTADSRG